MVGASVLIQFTEVQQPWMKSECVTAETIRVLQLQGPASPLVLP
jgi:hypothetical protein